MKEVAVSSKQSGVFLVFEYAHFDLANLVDECYDKYRKSPFTIPETKCLSKQLLSAMKYLHEKCIIHRDLKLSNLLYDRQKGILKLCDFGLSRRMSNYQLMNMNKKKTADKLEGPLDTSVMIPNSPPVEHLTPKVVSLWYRPPELLLNSEYYDFGVDSWGTGCVIAELLLGIPLFKGKSEMNQLQKIIEQMGTPTIKSWPGLKKMPLFKDGNCDLPFDLNEQDNSRISSSRKVHGRSKFLDKFSNLSTAGIMLLSNLLQYNPDSRLSAKDAYSSEWFQEYPTPTKREYMPTFPWKK